ncbi:tyrosine-protein phosphatase [Amycolatopsis acididurans]|nr:tyrosine-protein phosphatase [Amycolatopsis acididurans]
MLELVSVPNFRDIAGPVGYDTPRGPMRRGRIFRSSAFLASPEDLATLGGLGIAAIVDLRGRHEIERRPDSVLAGATWRHAWVPAPGVDLLGALRTAGDVRAAMIQHYREFVSAPRKRAGFAAALAAISDGTAPQLFHCAEGKDRTGWLAMLLQRLAGVSEREIVADYLMTNETMRGRGDSRAMVRIALGDRPDEFFAPALVADAAYLEAGMDQLRADYGDLEKYLSAGLGLSGERLDRLHALLVS